MAELILDFYGGTDLYSDGDIENDILGLVKRVGAPPNAEMIENFAEAYHLSPIRENILNWYPFKNNCSILEVGSGCGAITGLLCKRAQKLVSVELSKRRATINYERHKQYDNLFIVVSDLNTFHSDEKFDYVVVNGVFEYAGSFTHGRDPYTTFLQKLADFLKPDGVLLIAIENRIGLKYFNASQEDHTRNIYEGINGYKEQNSVKTFTQGEWKEMLKICGLNGIKFYYPYPDYKFPTEIFDDDTIYTMNYGTPLPNYEEGRMSLFDEYEVIRTLKRERILNHFANSFLIQAAITQTPLNECSVSYAKLNTDRRPEYQIGTEIEKEGNSYRVFKFPLSESAKLHIYSMGQSTTKDNPSLQILKGVKCGEGVAYQFLQGRTLRDMVDERLLRGEVGDTQKLIDDFFEKYCRSYIETETDQYADEQFEKYFGKVEANQSERCLQDAPIDLIMTNIFWQDGKWIIIDDEWYAHCKMPTRFVLWRMLNDYVCSSSTEDSKLLFKQMLTAYSISKQDELVYHQMAEYFASEYVGANKQWRFARPSYAVSLNSIREEYTRINSLRTAFYLDRGNGYSEQEKIYIEAPVHNKKFIIKAKINMPETVRSIRWDPVEQQLCTISNIAFSQNLIPKDDANLRKWEIRCRDPQMELRFVGGAAQNEIVVTGEVEFPSYQSAADLEARILQVMEESDRLFGCSKAE